MKPYLSSAATVFCFMVAVCCEATDSVQTPPLSCNRLGALPVTNPEQRFEIPAQGFSVLPPQGEHWCYKVMTNAGVSFFKIPNIGNASAIKPSRNEIFATRIFTALAMSLNGFKPMSSNIQSRDGLKNAVTALIYEQLFAQIADGVVSKQHSFRVLEADVTPASAARANCVRFNASVEEKGHPQSPDSVFLLNFPGNLVCAHPAASEIGLIWAGFVERYETGDKPTASTLKREYEPYLQSMQFMPPR